jgi:putative ABC transport system substrate-binding protein
VRSRAALIRSGPATAVTAALVLGAALLLPGAAVAQSPERVARVGYLWPGAPQPSREEAFRRGLREEGFEDGRNLTLIRRRAERYADLDAMAAELVRLRVDAIFAATAPAAAAARRATAEIPIVFEMLGDPVAAGLIASLSRPGGNLTGVTGQASELGGKRLELLKELVPHARRVAILINPRNPAGAHGFRESQEAARVLGLTLVPHEASTPPDLERVFAAMRGDRIDGLLVLQDPFFVQQTSRLVALAREHRLPALYGFPDAAERGGLAHYAPSLDEMFRAPATTSRASSRGPDPRTSRWSSRRRSSS